MSRLLHGEEWMRKVKPILDTVKLGDFQGINYGLPKRNGLKHVRYYTLKLRAIQLDTFEAWEIYRVYCKEFGYTPVERNHYAKV